MTKWHIGAVALLAGCKTGDYIQLYSTAEKAPSISWDSVEALDALGPTIIDEGVNFGLYSANATRVELLLFDDPESTRPVQQLPMVQHGDVWNLYVEGVGVGQYYGYIAWGPNWEYSEDFYPGSTIGFHADVDEQGNRFNPNKVLIDPYAKAVHRDHDWAKGNAASGPYRDQSTYAAAAKSVIVKSDYTWSETEDAWRAARASEAGKDWSDLVIYEVQVKGFTMNAASNQWGVEHFGTFRGLGEAAGYLSDLGITAVELLPIHEKPLDGGYWGYNNISYFAPEVTYSEYYSSTGDVDGIVDEFKWMVDELHQAGIEVIVDVVYNHTGEGGLWRTKLFYYDPDGDYLCDPGSYVALDSQEVSSLLTWRGIDSASYYVLADSNQKYWDGSTGVGNQTRSNHEPMRKLIMDSLRYYVEEMHVDGFRFDLAAALGEADGAPSEYWTDARDTVLQEIVDDPVLSATNTRVIAEPWSLAYDASENFPAASDGASGWGEWNANFRDWWRSFLNEGWSLNSGFTSKSGASVDGGGVMTGSYGRYADNGRQPYHSVNFITAHDGFTMFDLFSYEEKQNSCGPLNPICCYDACSAWCDPTSGEDNNRSLSWSDEPTKRQMIRNAFAGLMISHGTPMILGGDEWMRTQYGNNNAYTTWSDNEWAWFRWGEWSSENDNNLFRLRMHDFVRDMVRFRRERAYAFAPQSWGGGMPYAWKNANNDDADGDTWDGRHVMIHYYDDGAWDKPELLLLINMQDYEVEFELPSNVSWGRLVDTQSWFDLPGSSDEETGYFDEVSDADPTQSANITLDSPEAVTTTSYSVPANTIVILEEQP